MKHIYLADSIIHYPKAICIYHLKKDNYEAIIRLEGNALDKVRYFDVSTGLFHLKNGVQGTIVFEDLCLVSNESLPWGTTNIPKLPLYLYRISDNTLARLSSFYFNFDYSESFNIASQTLINQPEFNNLKLKTECKLQAGKVSVYVGDYPILLKENKPNIRVLSDLYKQFIKYNTYDKLMNQYINTKGLCHARAHFITQLLDLYSIDSIKVFKKWNKSDWANFDKTKNWDFHCAVLIVDNENNKWIWDPWVGFNHRLLTLKEWLFRKAEPTPRELLITNRMVLNPLSEGNAVYGSRYTHLSFDLFEGIQAVASDALPNRPTRYLADIHEQQFLRRAQHKNRFFQIKELVASTPPSNTQVEASEQLAKR